MVENNVVKLLHKIDKQVAVIEEQVHGINRRLDILNGKTDSTVTRVDSLESWKDNLKGRFAIIAISVSAAVSITIAFIVKAFT